jgi:hypothetical protein
LTIWITVLVYNATTVRYDVAGITTCATTGTVVVCVAKGVDKGTETIRTKIIAIRTLGTGGTGI